MTLDAALAALATDPSPAAQAAVHAALLDADVLVPRDDDGSLLVAPPDPARPGRGAALLAFSTAESLALWGLAPDADRMPARALLAAGVEEGIEQLALDPAGPVSVTLGSWEVRRLAAGELPAPGSDERLAVALPSPPLDAAFLIAVARAAAPLSGLEAVSAYEADPVRGRRHLVLGIALADPAVPAAPITDALHAALAPVAPDGALLNFSPPFPALEPAARVWRRGQPAV